MLICLFSSVYFPILFYLSFIVFFPDTLCSISVKVFSSYPVGIDACFSIVQRRGATIKVKNMIILTRGGI